MGYHKFDLFKHQSAFINAIAHYPDITYTFLIGGFGCGKSTSVVYACLYLIEAYKGKDVIFGIIGVSIKLLQQTVLHDLRLALDRGNVFYKENTRAGTLTVGTVTFIYLTMAIPDNIYAYNFSGVFLDELDEVPSSHVMPIIKAVQERCRINLPESPYMTRTEPFIAISTTAQGLGGTFLLTEYFRQHNIPFIKIRGRTQDNTTLSKSQLANLRKLYTPDEARAFLDGEFVNLTTGRVYYEFDPSKHVHMKFPLKDNETIYCGQDMNPGYNACVACIVRGSTIFVIATYHWDSPGDAPRLLREYYPYNEIYLIPDASGKEIWAGYRKELLDNDIKVVWDKKNPPILERVLALNKALRLGNLYIFEGLEKLRLAMLTRDFDDNGKPRKERGPEALDHECDALEYALWRIIHSIHGFEDVLMLLRGSYYNSIEDDRDESTA